MEAPGQQSNSPLRELYPRLGDLVLTKNDLWFNELARPVSDKYFVLRAHQSGGRSKIPSSSLAICLEVLDSFQETSVVMFPDDDRLFMVFSHNISIVSRPEDIDA